MAENYKHLFIPTSPIFRPSGGDLARFFEGIFKKGVVGPLYKIYFTEVHAVEPKVLVGRNPFTGESIVARMPTIQAKRSEVLPDATAIEARTVSATDFNVSVSGTGDPRTSPVAVDPENSTGYFTDPDDMTVFEVQGAGCASYSIELHFGKWLRPRSDSGHLALADPDFTRLAEETFGLDFLRGFSSG
jgi:hypothetical protein